MKTYCVKCRKDFDPKIVRTENNRLVKQSNSCLRN